MWEEQLNAAIEAGVAAIEGILKIYHTVPSAASFSPTITI